MKPVFVLGLLLICSAAALAQSAPDQSEAPSLIVTKHKHTVHIREYTAYKRDELSAAQLPSPKDGRGTTDERVGLHSSQEDLKPVRKGRIVFLYSAKVKNTGAKKIEAVVWDYIYVRTADETELGRFRFLSTSSIDPDKSKLLSAQTQESPPLNALKVVNVDDLGKKDVVLYKEKVEIKCIWYADGTSWRHANRPTVDCENFIQDKQRKTNKISSFANHTR